MYLHQSPILLYGSGKSVLPGYCFNMMWVWYFILEKQWSSMFLPNIIILKRHWRKYELHNKFSTLHYIYSFIMIIIYYSFTYCCALKISVGSLSDLSYRLNNNGTLHLYCFTVHKTFLDTLSHFIWCSEQHCQKKGPMYLC